MAKTVIKGDVQIEGDLTYDSISFINVYSASATSTSSISTESNVFENHTMSIATQSSDLSVNNTNKRIVYTGTETKRFHITANFEITNSANVDFGVELFQGGSYIAGTNIRLNASAGEQVGSTGCIVYMDTNAYIELIVYPMTGSATFSIPRANIQLIEIG